MASLREVTESPVYQGVDEQVAYSFDFSGFGTPSSPTVVLKDNTGTDVSSTKLSGSPSISGQTVITPKVIGLVAGIRYRLECKATAAGNVLEHYCYIYGEA